jgi:hypothetical protein
MFSFCSMYVKFAGVARGLADERNVQALRQDGGFTAKSRLAVVRLQVDEASWTHQKIRLAESAITGWGKEGLALLGLRAAIQFIRNAVRNEDISPV